MRKAIVVMLALLVVTAVAGAQTTYTDSLLGPHNMGEMGCNACHTPHNAMPGKGNFLWALSIPTGSYNTYQTSTGHGGTVTSSVLSGNGLASDTANATILCLGCHDTSFSGMNTQIGATDVRMRVGNNGDLTKDHPVHVAYPTTDEKYWKVTVQVDGSVSFNDTAYAYGHPAKLYASGGLAYLECGTCHNPHNYTSTIQMINGTGYKVTTTRFLRGQYASTADKTNFCMSCHAYMAGVWNGTGQ